MAGGPILPSSVYLGGASGNLYPNFYIPATNTNGAGALVRNKKTGRAEAVETVLGE